MLINEFLRTLDNVKGGPKRFNARCPAHDDQVNSLSVSMGADRRILVKCHAGCDVHNILSSLSLQVSDLFDDPPASQQRTPLRVVKRSEPAPEPTPSPAPAAHPYTAAYRYEDENGKLLFETLRFTQPDGSKTFRQRRPVGRDYAYNLDGVEPVLYRLPQIRTAIRDGAGVIMLCEGEKDADALCEMGLVGTTAPMGAGKWRDSYTAQLQGAAHVFVLPDNDKPGRAHALRVCDALQAAGISVSVADPATVYPELPLKGDVSDLIAKHGRDSVSAMFAQDIVPERFREIAEQRDRRDAGEPAYRFESANVYLREGFARDLQRQVDAPQITTGFTALDKQLGGRVYPGLYVIGAVSSLGKTAFCLQIADNIASQGQDVLFFSLEMPRVEMVARSLTRHLMMQTCGQARYNVGHILYGRIDQPILDAAIESYTAQCAGHIAIIEGGFETDVGGVAELARRHLQETGRRPIVFVDYLQILRPIDPRMNDKQAVDYNVVTLKRLSRELNAPVFVISSFNRQNYNEEVNMSSFKESGAIEYSADFVMGLQARGITERVEAAHGDERKAAREISLVTKRAKQVDPRPIEAVTLKNRRGPAWAKFEMEFYAAGNLFVGR